MITRRRLSTWLSAGALASPLAVFAQRKPDKIARIGYLSEGSETSNGAFLSAFRDALLDLGWIAFELIVNRKTAQALGIQVPDSILLRADKVID